MSTINPLTYKKYFLKEYKVQKEISETWELELPFP